MFDMNKMMEKVKEVQEKMKAAQENLADVTSDQRVGSRHGKGGRQWQKADR